MGVGGYMLIEKVSHFFNKQREKSQKDVLRSSLRGCVNIKYRNENGFGTIETNVGSGFYIKDHLLAGSEDHWYLITNYHVVNQLVQYHQQATSSSTSSSLETQLSTFINEPDHILIQNAEVSNIDQKKHLYNAKIKFVNKKMDLALLVLHVVRCSK